MEASIGSVGDAYDNALAESTIGLFKGEVIYREGPWKTMEQVELATLEWVDWYNNARLHGACDKLSPAAYEANYYHSLTAEQAAAASYLPTQAGEATHTLTDI